MPTTKNKPPARRSGKRTVATASADATPPTAAGRAAAIFDSTDYRALVTKYKRRSVDQLLDLQDILAEVRAMAEFAESIPVKDAREFLAFRAHTLTDVLENVERVHRITAKNETVDEIVQLRVAQLLTPIVLGFERIIQKYVPAKAWKEALADIRAVANLPTASIEVQARRIAE